MCIQCVLEPDQIMCIRAFTLSQNLVVLSSGLYMLVVETALMRIQNTSGGGLLKIIALVRLHMFASVRMGIRCSV